MDLIFYRQTYTQIWIVITSDEPLSILDSGGYIEDYYGNSSQITFRNVETNVRYEILFTNTDALSLSGYTPLSMLPNGTYALEGRIADLVGNTTIIGQISDTSVVGTVITVLLSIKPAIGIGGRLDTQFQAGGLNFRLALIQDAKVDTQLQTARLNLHLGLVPETGLNINTEMIRSPFNFSVKLFKEIPPIF